jgi:membrane protease YdiL (CAAX protease family)
MSAFLEPLILYFVLFLPGAVSRAPPYPDFIAFSVQGEIIRIFLYNIPSLALIWYLLLKTKSLKERGLGFSGRKDLPPLVIGFPCIILIGFTISLVSPIFAGGIESPRVESPGRAWEWIITVISCVTTGYLEESFFRYYLLEKFENSGAASGAGIFLAVLLFAFCHIYEGPWGVLNAVLAGFLLSFIFLHYRSLHGIALAHGLYNIFVYVAGS